MAYQKSNTVLPEELDKLWRYMDLPKFISLISKGALYFSRADLFSDPYEGLWTYTHRSDLVREGTISEERRITQIQGQKFFTMFLDVNCWHKNEQESEAMWKLYSGDNQGVAIQTTFSRLRDCFDEYRSPIKIGEVQYIDYNVDKIPEKNVFSPIMYKRNSFAYEKEVRAVYRDDFSYMQWHEWSKNHPPYEFNREERGTYIPVDLEILIEKIFVTPTASEWYYDIVVDICKKYGINDDLIQKSDFYNLPWYMNT